jgi:uncharacterized protein (TIGR02646 family)
VRNMMKHPIPDLLVQKHEVWRTACETKPTKNNLKKYRHPQIKQALMEETSGKCIYCESKLGHNCSGDVEHKIPVAHFPALRFEWSNLTIACEECNRRKSDYYKPDSMFLDPYSDDVESRLKHLGPVVLNIPGDYQAEVTLRVLELNSLAKRRHLIGRKFEKLEEIRNLVERIVSAPTIEIKEFLIIDLFERCEIDAEYSGMVKSYVDGLPEGWYS